MRSLIPLLLLKLANTVFAGFLLFGATGEYIFSYITDEASQTVMSFDGDKSFEV